MLIYNDPAGNYRIVVSPWEAYDLVWTIDKCAPSKRTDLSADLALALQHLHAAKTGCALPLDK